MCGRVVAAVTCLALMTSSAEESRAPESHAKRLYDDKLATSAYNKLIRPVDNASESLTIRIGLRLTSIIDVVSQSTNQPTSQSVETNLRGLKMTCSDFLVVKVNCP